MLILNACHDSPKMDKRFANDSDSTAKVGIPDEVLNAIPANSITFKSYVESEADLDKKTSESFKQSQSELLSLTPDLVQKCIDILSPYVQDRRMERIDEVLSQRTRHTRFLFENPSNPSNVWACLRTLDSFGIQYVDVIVNSDSYAGKAAVGQKKGMRTAMVRQLKSHDICSHRTNCVLIVYAISGLCMLDDIETIWVHRRSNQNTSRRRRMFDLRNRLEP